jgi:hypothetical protein
MKLIELISNISVYLTNEEKKFVNKYSSVKLSTLDEHNHWLAQNLVRKGVYDISNDCNTITKCK